MRYKHSALRLEMELIMKNMRGIRYWMKRIFLREAADLISGILRCIRGRMAPMTVWWEIGGLTEAAKSCYIQAQTDFSGTLRRC